MLEKSTRVFVCTVIKDVEGKFLLLKRSTDSGFAPGEWEFVSGTIEANETAEECIAREVNEETGLTLIGLTVKESFEITDKDGRWIVIPYAAKVDLKKIVISDEHSDFAWFTAEEIKALSYMQGMERLWAE